MDRETEHNDTHPSGDAVTGNVKVTRAIKMRVTDINWLNDEGVEGESPAATLSRLREEIISFRARCDGYESEILSLQGVNDVLQEGLDHLGSSRSLVPGQTVIGDFGGEVVKDAMDAIKDVCDDETVCIKTALHLIDRKTDVMDKQLDRDHDSEQKQLDREEKEKDRRLKQDIETSKAEHQKKLALIKRGIVDEKDLEGVVFLGSVEKRKTPGERLADMKNRAYHAAGAEDGEDFGDPSEFDGELVDDGESAYGEDSA